MNLENVSINIHSSIKISGSKNLYFDAFRIGEKKQDADYIFITHEHFDHYDPDSIANIKNENTIIIAPESMKKKMVKDAIVDEKNMVFLNPGETVNLGGVLIEAVPAYNSLKPFHPKHNKWLGYVVTMDDTVYYVAGDTDGIKENYNIKCDVAMVPAGGLYTMDNQQAAEYVLNIKPKVAIPTHYGEIAGNAVDGEKFKRIVEEKDSGIRVELKI